MRTPFDEPVCPTPHPLPAKSDDFDVDDQIFNMGRESNAHTVCNMATPTATCNAQPAVLESGNASSDDEGSLADFIVKDDAVGEEDGDFADGCDEEDEDEDDDDENDDEDGEDAGNASDSEDEDETTLSRDIDVANIVYGKRNRKAPARLFDELLQKKQTRHLYLCDIQDDEMQAALVDEDFSEGAESDEFEEDDDDDDDEDEEDSNGATPRKALKTGATPLPTVTPVAIDAVPRG